MLPTAENVYRLAIIPAPFKRRLRKSTVKP